MVALQSRYDGHGSRLIPSIEGFRPSLCVRTDFDKQCYNVNKLRSRGGPYARQSYGYPRSAEPSFGYAFPAIRGVQAGREYYVSMCPLRLVPKVFLFNEAELVPGLRAQRVLNRARLPELTNYILANRESYCFSALTASLDGPVRFEPLSNGAESSRIGTLHVPMDTQFLINDGQHRRAAIENALREDPDLADESIAIVFFLDRRARAVPADVRGPEPARRASFEVTWESSTTTVMSGPTLVRLVVQRFELFQDVVEHERTTLSARSRKLFTLSAIYTATNALTAGHSDLSLEERVRITPPVSGRK